MFDRLTRSLYDELSRDPFARFVKLFDPSERVSFIRNGGVSVLITIILGGSKTTT